LEKDTIYFSKQLKQLNKTTPEVGYDNDNITQISEKTPEVGCRSVSYWTINC